jgi:hypothetical protein
MLVAEVPFDMQHLAELAGRSDALQRLHRRPQAAIVSDAEDDTGAAARFDHRYGVDRVERKRLLAKHLFAGACGSFDHRPVQRMRRRQHHGPDLRIGERFREVADERQLVARCKIDKLLGSCVDAAHEADALAFTLYRFDEIPAPAAYPHDRSIYHRPRAFRVRSRVRRVAFAHRR